MFTYSEITAMSLTQNDLSMYKRTCVTCCL